MGKTRTLLCSFCGRSDGVFTHLLWVFFVVSGYQWQIGQKDMLSMQISWALKTTFEIYEKYIQLLNHIILLGKQIIC